MSAITHVLTYVGTPALILAAASSAWRVSRSVLLYRAGSTALKWGSEDERGKAGPAIVEALTRRESEPWYRAILPGRRSDDGPP